jgi:hypothetical protein
MAYSDNNANPIELVLRNLGGMLPFLLLFVGWLVATWKKVAKRNAETRAPAPPNDDEAGRTRRVQEDVRRKIAERRGTPPPRMPASRREGPLASPTVAPRPVARRFGNLREELETPDGDFAPALAADDAAEKARQDRLAREIASIDAGLPPPIATHQAYAPPQASPAPSSAWQAILRDPESVRRAIVLREILGSPVGLR